MTERPREFCSVLETISAGGIGILSREEHASNRMEAIGIQSVPNGGDLDKWGRIKEPGNRRKMNGRAL